MKFTKWSSLNLLFIFCGLIFFTSCSEVENYKEPVLVGTEYKGNVDAETQERAAEGVIKRLLGEEVAYAL